MRSQKREIQKVRIKNLYFKGFLNETGSLSAFIQHLIENMKFMNRKSFSIDFNSIIINSIR
jgi:capsule polysaccharide modification protein KpsS